MTSNISFTYPTTCPEDVRIDGLTDSVGGNRTAGRVIYSSFKMIVVLAKFHSQMRFDGDQNFFHHHEESAESSSGDAGLHAQIAFM